MVNYSSWEMLNQSSAVEKQEKFPSLLIKGVAPFTLTYFYLEDWNFKRMCWRLG